MVRRNTVLLGLRDRLPNYTRQIQIRFGRYQLGQNSNRASLFPGVKYWEIIADNLSKAGWSWGYVSALDRQGRTIWIVDAHGYGKRFVVHSADMLTAFVELAIRFGITPEDCLAPEIKFDKLSRIK